MFSFLIQRNYHPFDLCLGNFINTSSSFRSSTKFSRHLIFQTNDPFLDNQAVGRFVNFLLEDIHGCLINHHCSAMSSNSSLDPLEQTPISTESNVFAKNLLSTLEQRLARFETCECIDDYSQMRFKDIAEFLVKKADSTGVTWFCDMSNENTVNQFELIFIRLFIKRRVYKESSISVD